MTPVTDFFLNRDTLLPVANKLRMKFGIKVCTGSIHPSIPSSSLHVDIVFDIETCYMFLKRELVDHVGYGV